MIIGIDPSLTNFAVVVLSHATGRVLSTKVFTSTPTKSRIERIDTLLKKVFQYIDKQVGSWRDHCEFIIEGYSYGSKFYAHQLGELGGCLRYKLYCDTNWRENVIEYAPTMVKKFTTGKGNAKKELMLLNVFKKWGFETNSSDLADAYAVARIRLAMYDIETGKKKISDYLVYEQTVLKAIRKLNGSN